MLKTQIKASQINNLTDARYFAAWGVEWLGFDLNEGSESYLPPEKVKEIKAWVEGPRIVGEFMLQTPNEIRMLADNLELDDIQVNNFADLDYLKALEGISIIKEIVIDPETTSESLFDQLETMQPYVAQFLLNFDKSGITWDTLQQHQNLSWQDLKKATSTYEIILSFDFKAKAINTLIEELKPRGINVKGGTEEKIGFKSFDEMDELFEVLEVFD